jgi:hypothetical protein
MGASMPDVPVAPSGRANRMSRLPVAALPDRLGSPRSQHLTRSEGRTQEIRSRRFLIADAVTVCGLCAAVVAAYAWTHAPLYNPFGTIDPWLYTGVWTNFHQIYAALAGSYYTSRLPWIAPGLLANWLFEARTAAIVLHASYFLVGGVLFYVLCRRWFGAVPAAIGYVALIGSQMYFNAHRWDYQEGGVLTYMIGAYAFALPRTRSPWLRSASLFLGGASAAAMATTRVFDVIYLIGLPLLYVAVLEDRGWAARLRRIVVDAAAFAVGFVAVLIVGGLASRAAGTEFWFFMPQIHVVQNTSGGYNQIPVDQWLPGAPYFWTPVFAIAFGVIVLAFAQTRRSLLLASVLWLVLDFVPLALWQFLSDGWVFNIEYYFSSFLVPTLVCLVASAAVLLGTERLSFRSAPIVAAAAIAVIGSDVWIYRSDSVLRVARSYLDGRYITAFVAIGLALVLSLLASLRRVRALSAAAVIASVFAVSFGVDASGQTLQYGGSDPRTGSLYDVGQRLISVLRANGYERELPYFWYDGEAEDGALGSVQSLYYYSWTQIGITMPRIDDAFRSRFAAVHPRQLVLLCSDESCDGGGAALSRAGYAPQLRLRRLLESGAVKIWVKIYDVRPQS